MSLILRSLSNLLTVNECQATGILSESGCEKLLVLIADLLVCRDSFLRTEALLLTSNLTAGKLLSYCIACTIESLYLKVGKYNFKMWLNTYHACFWVTLIACLLFNSGQFPSFLSQAVGQWIIGQVNRDVDIYASSC